MVNYIPHSLINDFVTHLQSQGKSEFTVVAYKKDLEQFVGFLTTKEKTDIREVKKRILTALLKSSSPTDTQKISLTQAQLNPYFFRYLKNLLVIDQNPSLDVTHPKYTSTSPRILSKLEYHALRDFAKDDSRTYALVEILLQTGIKIGELANIHSEDLKDSMLSVRPYGKTRPAKFLLISQLKRRLPTI